MPEMDDHYRALAETLDLLTERVARYTVDGLVLLYCNRAWAAQHESEPAELIGRRMDELLHDGEMDGLRAQVSKLGPDTPFLYDPVPRPSPRIPDRWVEWADRYLPGPDGAHILAVGRDVTERHAAEQQLAVSEALFRELADRSADAVWRLTTHPAPHLAYLSPSVERMTGWAREDFGDDLTHLRSILDEDGLALAERALRGGDGPPRFDLRVRCADGAWMVLELQVSRVAGALQGTGRDVTEIRRLQADLADLALRDPLTGLANRRLLDVLLHATLARTRRAGTPVVVTYLDLDGFKSINDTHGHAAGDVVLIEVARRLQATVREADVVARRGGDEFVVVHESDPAQSEALLRRVREALAAPVTLPDGTTVPCGASIGSADTSQARDAAGLLAAADQAMYVAKRARTHERPGHEDRGVR